MNNIEFGKKNPNIILFIFLLADTHLEASKKRHYKGEPYRFSGKRDPLQQTKKAYYLIL